MQYAFPSLSYRGIKRGPIKADVRRTISRFLRHRRGRAASRLLKSRPRLRDRGRH